MLTVATLYFRQIIQSQQIVVDNEDTLMQVRGEVVTKQVSSLLETFLIVNASLRVYMITSYLFLVRDTFCSECLRWRKGT